MTNQEQTCDKCGWKETFFGSCPNCEQEAAYWDSLNDGSEQEAEYWNQLSRLHESFRATRRHLIPLAKLYPTTVGTKSNFRRLSVITAMEDIGIPECQYGLISKSYDAWRTEETGYFPAEGDAHMYTNEEGYGPCPECGEARDLEEDAPCENCNIL